MAKINLWRKFFCNCEVVENILRQEAKVKEDFFNAQILGLKKQIFALAGGLYRVERYRIGPESPTIGKFDGEVSLSDVPVSLHEQLFMKREVVCSSGSSPVSWAGTRWVLIEK